MRETSFSLSTAPRSGTVRCATRVRFCFQEHVRDTDGGCTFNEMHLYHVIWQTREMWAVATTAVHVEEACIWFGKAAREMRAMAMAVRFEQTYNMLRLQAARGLWAMTRPYTSERYHTILYVWAGKEIYAAIFFFSLNSSGGRGKMPRMRVRVQSGLPHMGLSWGPAGAIGADGQLSDADDFF